MIYVIKPGTNFIQKQCSNCHCIFAFEEEDVETRIRIGGIVTKDITCPCCGKIIVWRV